MSNVNEQVAALVKKGYKIISDGPTGVQLEKKKSMRALDVLCLFGGLVMLVVFLPVGVLMIAIALFDYAFMTPSGTKFIGR